MKRHPKWGVGNTRMALSYSVEKKGGGCKKHNPIMKKGGKTFPRLSTVFRDGQKDQLHSFRQVVAGGAPAVAGVPATRGQRLPVTWFLCVKSCRPWFWIYSEDLFYFWFREVFGRWWMFFCRLEDAKIVRSGLKWVSWWISVFKSVGSTHRGGGIVLPSASGSRIPSNFRLSNVSKYVIAINRT